MNPPNPTPGTASSTRNTLGKPGPLVLGPLFLLLAVLPVSCAHTDRDTATAPPMEVPGEYTLYPEQTPSPDRWWEGFGSGELNALVSETLTGNLSLLQSLSRLRQADVLVVQAGADRMPDLSLNAGASETRRETGGQSSRSRSRSLTLASSWEIDFWGRLKAAESDAILEREGSRELLYSSALTLASETTLKWLELISVRRQMEVLVEQLETNRTILDLMEQRYLKGLANALDVYQQRQAVAETEGSLPQLKVREETLLYEIAVLAGRPPRADLGLTADRFPDLGPLPERGVPADLLARRPDIRSAGLTLRAAEWGIVQARAGRLPKVTLSATAGYSSDSFADLLEDWLMSLAANLTWTLFDSGAKRAEVSRQEAVAEEKLAAYRLAVLTAIREVEEAMAREASQVLYIESLQGQLDISRDGFREAVSRYRKGLSDYLPVLTALSSTQRLERSIVQARLERISQRVKLHRALGGGWMEEEFKNKND